MWPRQYRSLNKERLQKSARNPSRGAAGLALQGTADVREVPGPAAGALEKVVHAMHAAELADLHSALTTGANKEYAAKGTWRSW